MKITKRIFTTFLVVLMMVTSLPLGQFDSIDWNNLFCVGLKANAASAGGSNTFNTFMADVILNNYTGSAKIGDTTLPHLRYTRFTDLELATVAKPVVEEINANITFRVSEAAWEVATFSPSSMLSSEEKKVEYYEAILLSLVNATVSVSLIPSAIVSYEKNTTKIAKKVAELKKLDIQSAQDVNLWNCHLTAEEANEIYQNFAKEEWNIEKRIQNYSSFTNLLDAYSDAKSFVEDIATYCACVDLSENVISVLDELNSHCPIMNYELKTAILKVKEASKSKFNGFALALADVIRSPVEDALDELWEGVLEGIVGDLAIGILAGQAIGKSAANILFSTDKVIEQWYKMNAFVIIEEALVSSIKSLGNKFINSHSDEDAQVFLASLSLLAEAYEQDYSMSEDLGEYLYEKGAWNNIKKYVSKLFGKYDDSEIKEFHDNIAYLKDSITDLTEILSQEYYQNFYNIDNNLDTTDIKDIDFKTGKVVSVACPVDVDVYDSNGTLCLSVKDNEVIVSSFDNFIIVDGEVKKLFLNTDDDYRIKITATDEGTMDYSVYELQNNQIVRSVSYVDVDFEKSKEFTSEITSQLIQPTALYNLKTNTGDIIEPTFDSLPPIQDTLTDVIVAEELFEGFSTELIDKVANTMFSLKSSVDIESYAIKTDDAVALFSAIAKYYPSEYSILVNGDFTYRIICSPERGIITKIHFYYGSDTNLSDYQRRVNELNAEVNKLVSKMQGMNEFEKALYLHDYIVLNSEYDTELLDILETTGTLTGELRSERYTEYSILVNGTGICGSYALAYRAVLNAAGMECLYLSSAGMNHAWNLVKIYGNWYHVDCCWDDPVPDTFGRAKRTYFLRTDDEIMNLQHYSWTPGQYKATSSTFSNMPRNYDVMQKYDSGNWYYLSGGKLYKADVYGNGADEICSLTANAIDVDNGNIYYAKNTSVYKYNDASAKGVMLYTMSASEAGDSLATAFIRNLYVDGNNVEIYKSIYKNSKQQTVKSTVELNDRYASVTGIEISETNLTLDVFETKQLAAKLISTTSTSGIPITWSSSNKTVASIGSNGKITANNIGSAIITASFGDYYAECQLNVTGDGLSGICGNNIIWTYNVDTGLLELNGSGDMYNYEYVYSWNTTAPWNLFKQNVKNISMSAGIKTIGNYAFFGFDNVLEVVIPKGVKTIGQDAFSGNNVKLEKVTIPNTVTEIKNGAFANDFQLSSVYITDIASWCNITFENERANPLYHAKKLYLNNELVTDIIIPSSVIEIKNYVFYNFDYLETINLNDKITSIGDYAFYSCDKLNSIKLSETLKSIGEQAFCSCNSLTTLDMPPLLEEVGYSTFKNCTNIKKVNISNLSKWCYIWFKDYYSNPLFYAKNLFLNDRLITNLVIPNGVTELNRYTFYGADCLETVVVSDYVEKMDYSVFENCSNLRTAHLGANLSHLYSNSLSNCAALTNITVSEKNTNYSSFDGVLYDYAKTQIIIYPSGKQDKIYNIPEGVVGSISGFSTNSYLETINIPSSVVCITGTPTVNTNVNNYAFARGLSNLKGFVVDENNEYFCSVDGVLFDKNITTLYTYPANKADVVYFVPDSVTNVKSYRFTACRNLKSLIIPESVTETMSNTPSFFDDVMFGKINTSLEYLFVSGLTKLPVTSLLKYYPNLKKIYTLNPNGELNNYHNCQTTFYGTYNSMRAEKFVDINAEPHEHDYFLMGYCEMKDNQDGYEYWECYCGKDSYTTVIHNYGEATTIEATCLVDGYKQATCNNCGETNIIETVSATGHNYIVDTSTEGNCVTNPVTTYKCTYCGDTYAEEGVPDDRHDYVTTVINPTCTEKGYTQDVCSLCGETAIYNFKSPLGHKMSVKRTEATCTEYSKVEYTCSRCDYHEILDDTVSGLVEHRIKTVITDATCTENGKTEELCSVCGNVFSCEVITAPGHAYGDWVTTKEASCKLEGLRTKTCENCGDVFAEIIEKTSHKYSITTVSSTCTEKGYTTHTCSICGDSYTDCEVAATGHTPSDWIIDKVATCTDVGLKHTECLICHTTLDTAKIPAIPVTGHSISLDKNSVDMRYKASEKINANATGNVVWSSSNPKVVSVDGNGNIKALKRGSAMITATVEGTNVSENCTVNVNYTWWQWIIVIVLFGWIWY